MCGCCALIRRADEVKQVMNKNRIGWLALALIQLFLLLTAEAYWCIYTLAAQIMAAAISAVMAGLLSKKVEIEIEKGAKDSKNRKYGFWLRLKDGEGAYTRPYPNSGRFRLASSVLPGMVAVICQIENLLTGDKVKEQVLLKTGPLAEKERYISIDSLYCGKIEMTVTDVKVTDIFGLTAFSPAAQRRTQTGNSNRKAAKKASLLIIPGTYPVFSQGGKSGLLDLDGSLYSTVKAGFDRSEIFSVREYREGDRISGIHWKLTNKIDTVMVREGSLPIKNSLLILMETCFGQDEADLKGRSQRTVTAVLSLSESLVDEGIGHHIGWWDSESQEMKLYEIGRIEDLMDILGQLLSAKGSLEAKTVMERYYEELGAWEFSHVAVVEDEIKGDVELYN